MYSSKKLILHNNVSSGVASQMPSFWFLCIYLEVGDLSDDRPAEFGDGVRVLAERDQVTVSDGWEALMAQQLLSDFTQARLDLQLLTHIGVGSNKDDWRQRSHCLTTKKQNNKWMCWGKCDKIKCIACLVCGSL